MVRPPARFSGPAQQRRSAQAGSMYHNEVRRSGSTRSANAGRDLPDDDGYRRASRDNAFGHCYSFNKHDNRKNQRQKVQFASPFTPTYIANQRNRSHFNSTNSGHDHNHSRQHQQSFFQQRSYNQRWRGQQQNGTTQDQRWRGQRQNGSIQGQGWRGQQQNEFNREQRWQRQQQNRFNQEQQRQQNGFNRDQRWRRQQQNGFNRDQRFRGQQQNGINQDQRRRGQQQNGQQYDGRSYRDATDSVGLSNKWLFNESRFEKHHEQRRSQSTSLTQQSSLADGLSQLLRRNLYLAQQGFHSVRYAHNILQKRESEWKRLSSEQLQRRLLLSPSCLKTTGVIYALMVAGKIYVGQTVNSTLHRAQQHVRTAFAKTRPNQEHLVSDAIKKSKWAQKMIFLPLEVIPMPYDEPLGRHSNDYIKSFRQRSLVREQRWIKLLNSGQPYGWNIVVSSANPNNNAPRPSERRHEHQPQPGQNAPDPSIESSNKQGRSENSKSPCELVKMVDGKLFVSLEKGPAIKQRKLLHEILMEIEKGRSPEEALSKHDRPRRSALINFLVEALDVHVQLSAEMQTIFDLLNTRAQQALPADDVSMDLAPTKKRKPDNDDDDDRPTYLKIPWKRSELAKINLDKLVHSAELKALHPVPSIANNTRISYNLNVPIGVIFTNYTALSRSPFLRANTPPDVPDAAQCPCQKWKTPGCLLDNGHVITTDPSSIPDEMIRALWLKGRKYRCQFHLAGVYPGIVEGVNEYICKCQRRHRSADFSKWRDAFLAAVKKQLQQFMPSAEHRVGMDTSPDAIATLRALHKDMVVTHTDKSQHDLVMACRAQYLHKLWNELHSPVYAPVSVSAQEVASAHMKNSDKFDRSSNNNHRYLYGCYKLHKAIPSMRWLCGNHLADIGDGVKQPACTLSVTEAAVAGILRLIMQVLEKKDKVTMRKQGLKRYWVVTGINPVAKEIKSNQQLFAKHSAFTKDFATMYTNLPHPRIVQRVFSASTEAINFTNLNMEKPFTHFAVKFDRLGKAEAHFAHEGIPFADLESMLKIVVTEVYIQVGQGDNSDDGVLLQQRAGVPMGGKASSEIANVFCYDVESSYIDKLLAEKKDEEARIWSLTWRFIDDILGFGDRRWEEIGAMYEMEFKDTTLVQSMEVVFLGMHVKRHPKGLWMMEWPKGQGWSWQPQKYITYSSCHTPWTKRYLLKGLLVRAAIICNTNYGFKQAVERYVRGLVHRGCSKTFLLESWKSFASGQFEGQGSARTILTRWFYDLVDAVCAEFAAWPLERPPPELPTSPKPNAKPSKQSLPRQQLLLCGVRAVNSILSLLKRPSLTKEQMDALNDVIATEEALIMDEGSAVYNAVQPAGNYPVDVVTTALRVYGDCQVDRMTASDQPSPGLYIIGNGYHWQMAYTTPQGDWLLRDSDFEFPIHDRHAFFRARFIDGAILRVTLPTVNPSASQALPPLSPPPPPTTTGNGTSDDPCDVDKEPSSAIPLPRPSPVMTASETGDPHNDDEDLADAVLASKRKAIVEHEEAPPETYQRLLCEEDQGQRPLTAEVLASLPQGLNNVATSSTPSDPKALETRQQPSPQDVFAVPTSRPRMSRSQGNAQSQDANDNASDCGSESTVCSHVSTTGGRRSSSRHNTQNWPEALRAQYHEFTKATPERRAEILGSLTDHEMSLFSGPGTKFREEIKKFKESKSPSRGPTGNSAPSTSQSSKLSKPVTVVASLPSLNVLPATSVAVYSLAQVTCMNESAIPTTARIELFPVINGFCTNCLRYAVTAGHVPSTTRRYFASKEEYEKYCEEHYVEEDDKDTAL